MSSFIKINPFNWANTDLSENVEEYLDDVETAAFSSDLSVTPGISEATDRSKIRLFRQNLERNGDAWHWWYYVLPEANKKDYGKIVMEFKDRYGVKATQASSLFAVQNEMLSLLQGETEHIRDYVHRVERLSRKIPREMDSLFAIAFVKGMRDQERKQRVTFDLKDSPNFSFLKALTVVKFSFQEIGEPDPFRPNQASQDNSQAPAPLYTAPTMPLVNMVSKTEIAHPSAGNLAMPLGLTQEQFNAFMSSYEAMMGRGSRLPFSSAGNPANNRRPNPRVTCFNCGNRGHYSDTCVNQPLSAYEQQEVRERIRRERELTMQEFRRPDTNQAPPLSGSNSIEIASRPQVPRSPLNHPKVGTVSSAPVTCLRSCSVSQEDLGIACVVAARIPAVRTIFENALAEKRVRVDDSESDIVASHRAPKVPRRNAEPMENNTNLRRSFRSTNNPLAHRREPEIQEVEEEDQIVDDGLEAMEEVIRVGNQFEEVERTPSERIFPVSTLPKKTKEKVVTAPINWMHGESPFTIRDALNGPSSRLQITLPQLLDCSPRLRRDLAELLRSSVPRSRKKRVSSTEKGVEPMTLHSSKFSIGTEVLSEAGEGADDNVECLYIEAWIGKVRVQEVLVDAGAMLDLISSQLVEKLRLERFPVTGLGMRLADDRLVVLRHYVWLDVVVAGVLARIKAYEVSVSQTYQLLLSRRWLKRVRAVEYHDSRTLFIEGSDRVRRKVPAVPSGEIGVKMENIEPQSFFDVDDDEAEDAVETLLNELDHWEEGAHEPLPSEN